MGGPIAHGVMRLDHRARIPEDTEGEKSSQEDCEKALYERHKKSIHLPLILSFRQTSPSEELRTPNIPVIYVRYSVYYFSINRFLDE